MAEEKKYFERLNISVLSINKIKQLIKNDIKATLCSWEANVDVLRQCFRIIGPAGVGKTQIMHQIVKELSAELKVNFDILMIKAPVLSRDDFIIPFPIIDNGNTSFKMLYSDFVPKDKDSYGLFVIDEFSRGDHSLQQLLWQVMNEYKLHLLDFPKNWFVVCVDNPDDSEYQMDVMEDAAGLRRQLHIYTEVSVTDFLDYAIEQKFHDSVIEFIQTHPDFLYDFNSQKHGAVFANPASYEALSDHMKKIDLACKGNFTKAHFETIEMLASGLLNVNMASMFMEFLTETKHINPKDIFYKYHEIRPGVLKRDQADFGKLMDSFNTYLKTSKPDYEDPKTSEQCKANVIRFLCDMPIDSAARFLGDTANLDKKSEEFIYITMLHQALLESKDCQTYRAEFYNKIVDMMKNG